jgi:hypothetical protein
MRSRLTWVAAFLFVAHSDATAQRVTPAAFASRRDSSPTLVMTERLHANSVLGHASQDSARSGPERIAGVIGGALLGGATGLAVAAVYAPKIFCDICQPGNAPAVARNKYFFRGPMIGVGVGAVIGWWFFGRS